jgi:hypothetical protein
MAKWSLDDRKANNDYREVYILHDDPLEKVNERQLIYHTAKVEFRILQEMKEDKIKYEIHDEAGEPTGKFQEEMGWVRKKTVGYLFRYKYNLNYPKFNLYNSFGINYNKKLIVNTDENNFITLFEDKVIRLLAYEHPNKVKDYWLIGRWRSNDGNDASST